MLQLWNGDQWLQSLSARQLSALLKILAYNIFHINVNGGNRKSPKVFKEAVPMRCESYETDSSVKLQIRPSTPT